MKRYILLLVFLPAIALGQTEVMHNAVRDYEQKPIWGANRTHYLQGFLGFGFYTPISVPSRDFKIGSSFDFEFGAMYRYRLANFVNVGMGLGFLFQEIELNNQGMVKDWDTQVHSKANVSNSILSAKPFIRLNLSPKRGDYLGTFIDLGGFANWNFYPITSFTDKQGVQRYVQQYVFDKKQERVQYGAFVVLGRDWFRIEGSYYLSNWFRSNADFFMPRYKVSVVFGI
jgi:hypothetical protein